MTFVTNGRRVPTPLESIGVDLDELYVNTIRTLSMDAVQRANPGHPGTPMALAPVVYCLWQRLLRFDPNHPIWPNRDRFVLSVGWNVTRVGDANDLAMLEWAFKTFKNTSDRPTLIIVDSHIAYGAPNKQDTSAAHGEPLGAEEIRLAKQHYGWPEDAKFLVPDAVREHFAAGMGARGLALFEQWWATFEEYRRQYPERADHGSPMLRRQLPDTWDAGLPSFSANGNGVATRDASGQALNAIARNVPWLLGGSASTLGWARYVGPIGRRIGMETFGASARLQELQKKFGFTVENVVLAAREQIQNAR